MFKDQKTETIPKIDLTNILAEILGDTQAQLKKSEITNIILSSIIALLIISWIMVKFI